MTPGQWAIAGVAFVVFLLAGDVARSRDWPTWPQALAILVMAGIGGWYAWAWLVTASLGAGLGWVVVGGLHVLRAGRSRRDGAEHTRRGPGRF